MRNEITQAQVLSIDALIALAAGAFVALFVAYLLARIAVDRGFVLDEPNMRSSHAAPTPRSGGVAIMVGWGVGALFFMAFAPVLMSRPGLFGFIGLVWLATGLGFLDDRYNLPALVKLFGQSACAAGFIALCGPLALETTPLLSGLAGFGIVTGIIGFAVTFGWIVAFMNTYNFMDGANGIAGVCAVIALCALAGVSAFTGVWPVMAFALVLAFALCGFLRLNFPLGTIFMGDSGSHGVAFAFSGLAVIAANQSGGAITILFAPIAMAPFLFDVFFTLTHRFMRGQNVMAAHREHLYQLMLRGGASHVQVTGLYAGATLVCAFIAAGAMFLAPLLQWAALIGVMAAFLWPALSVYKKSKRAGFFAIEPAFDGAGQQDDSAPAL